jgi:hypothetical protein
MWEFRSDGTRMWWNEQKIMQFPMGMGILINLHLEMGQYEHSESSRLRG